MLHVFIWFSFNCNSLKYIDDNLLRCLYMTKYAAASVIDLFYSLHTSDHRSDYNIPSYIRSVQNIVALFAYF